MESSEAALAAPKAVFDIAAKVDSFLCRSVPWHDGHAAAGDDARTSVSNSFPQEPQVNSNMGIIERPQNW